MAIRFERHPEIALGAAEYATGQYRTHYTNDYLGMFAKVKAGVYDERTLLRTLFAKDLWFLIRFGFGIEKANHPFVVKMCREVEQGPRTDTLDIWARFHWKAVDLYEDILTTSGWKNHGSIMPGEYVFHPSGKPVRVMARTKVFQNVPCSEIVFTDGHKVKVSDNHLWRILRKVRRRIRGTEKRRREFIPEIIETRHLKVGNDVGVSAPIEFPQKTLPVPPYTFGAWLGDGYSRGGSITIAYTDKEIIDYISQEGIRVLERKSSNANTGLFSLDAGTRGKKNTGLTSTLRKLGVKDNKHIPTIYLCSSTLQRMELLRGLMDTDGDINGRGTATFTNKSERLACDVYGLAASLGLRPRKRRHVCRLQDGSAYPFFHVSFQAYQDYCPFKLRRKFLRCSTGKRAGTLRRLVKHINKIESIPVSCIQVEGDGTYLVGRGLIPTHNSSIITQAETLQFEILNPDKCTGIFCYARPAAKKPLRSLKVLLEQSDLLQWCFPEVLWKRPEGEAPKWSEDEGLVLKRSNASRKESSIEAHGLIEGMPTGSHFERNVFDDLETEDIRESPDMLAKVFSKFQMAAVNLGTGSDSDQTRVIGTYYSHYGPNVKIRDMAYPDGQKIYTLRLIPGSDDGTRKGKPILMDAKSWEKAKMSQHFNSQQLCDPTPMSDLKLDFTMLKPIEPQFIPKDIYKFMVLDQAGGDETDRESKDLWSFGVFGVDPVVDDIGQSKVYMLDVEADQMSHSEGIDGVVRMYLRNGIIHRMGVEKVGLATTEIHISNALKAYGRRVTQDAGNLVLLKPGGRSKNFRIESALQWPLNNGKLFYSTAINKRYISAIQEEMQKFPFFHVDILDMWAYLYDIIKEINFFDEWSDDEPEQKPYNDSRDRVTGY